MTMIMGEATTVAQVGMIGTGTIVAGEEAAEEAAAVEANTDAIAGDITDAVVEVVTMIGAPENLWILAGHARGQMKVVPSGNACSHCSLYAVWRCGKLCFCLLRSVRLFHKFFFAFILFCSFFYSRARFEPRLYALFVLFFFVNIPLSFFLPAAQKQNPCIQPDADSVFVRASETKVISLCCVCLILDLDFDCTLRWISCNMEGVNGIFQCEAMGDEWFDVDKTTCDESDGLGILFIVSSIHSKNRRLCDMMLT